MGGYMISWNLKKMTVKWYIMMLFEMMIKTAISKLIYVFIKSRLNILKIRTLKCGFWRYLKRFGTAEKKMKTKSLKRAFWQYLKRFGTTEKNNEHDFSKACLLVVFDTLGKCYLLHTTIYPLCLIVEFINYYIVHREWATVPYLADFHIYN